MSRSPVYIVYMYVQPRCKIVNMATYVHTGGVSNTYNEVILFVDNQLAESEQSKQCRLFIGSQLA